MFKPTYNWLPTLEIYNNINWSCLQMRMAAALEEDPTVYQYDEVYDQIEEKKQEENKAKNADKVAMKPRYILNMMKNFSRI